MENQRQDSGPVIRMFGVGKRYGAKAALSEVSLEIDAGEFVFLTGPSGAGKSTFLKLLYLAEPPSEGQILLAGMNLARMGRRQLPRLRRSLGVVFQDYKLIATRNVYENVALVLDAAGADPGYTKKKVRVVLKKVGMEDRMASHPPALSGGEKQRVAVARALANDPAIILADEPTGNLDLVTGEEIIRLLKRLSAERGVTVISATHDYKMLSVSDRVVWIRDGAIERIENRDELSIQVGGISPRH